MADYVPGAWEWETFFTELRAFLRQSEREKGLPTWVLLSMFWSVCVSLLSVLVTCKVFSLQLKVTRGNTVLPLSNDRTWTIYSLDPRLREVHSFDLGSIDSVCYRPWVERFCIQFLDLGQEISTRDFRLHTPDFNNLHFCYKPRAIVGRLHSGPSLNDSLLDFSGRA